MKIRMRVPHPLLNLDVDIVYDCADQIARDLVAIGHAEFADPTDTPREDESLPRRDTE